MATTTTAANLLTLKRPHAIDIASNHPNTAFVTTTGTLGLPHQTFQLSPTRPKFAFPDRRRRFISHSKSHTWPHDRKMPLQMSSQSFTDTFATLSPIYDQDLPSATSQSNESTQPSMTNRTDSTSISNASHSNSTNTAATQHPYFFHRGSFSTSTSGSSCSSPTTTASLADLVAHETPGTSPDTPASSQSLSYPSLSLALRAAPDGKPDFGRVSALAPSSKKPRNLKNLAVNTSSTLTVGRSATTAALPVDMPSSISPAFPSPQRSATFVKPMQPPPRRKASALGLTIKTPSSATHPSSLAPFHQLDRLVPPTPSLVRPTALRSFQSSPSLPLLTSRFPPERGMRLPSFSSSTDTLSPAFVDIPVERDEDEESQNFDIPQSREEKPDAYPDGPICIYDPLVYLYFEPTAVQASEFDVIFNVASEVKNPFLVADSQDTRLSRTLDQVSLEDEINGTTKSSSPSTPTQADIENPQLKKNSGTEYIHIPWEHNTDIVPDLYKLVKVVDQRVQSGKKVLIHCQCGVSRSASLIVAYGLYKKPMITVQEAYDAVKKRSKWIGPNMNLIMQLQEFRSGLLRRNGGGLAVRGQTPSHSNSASDSGIPRTAPLLATNGKNVPKPINTEGLTKVAPGPSSAPSGLQWPSQQSSDEKSTPASETTAATTTTTTNHSLPLNLESSYVDATGNVVSPSAVALSEPSPMKASSKELSGLSLTSLHSLKDHHARAAPPPPLSFAMAMSIPTPVESPRSADFGMTSASPPAGDESFGITSPRDTSFSSSSTVQQQQQKPAELDSIASPRSIEFGMTPFKSPEEEDTLTLGLTSPRMTNFSGPSIFGMAFENTAAYPPPPSHPPPPIPTAQAPIKVTAILPAPESLQSSLNVQARAELRSQLGLSSKTSHTNMRSGFTASLRSDSKLDPSGNSNQLRPTLPPSFPLQAIPDDSAPSSPESVVNANGGSDSPPSSTSSSPAPRLHEQTKQSVVHLSLHDNAVSAPQGDFADALMSPRATEFTSNPFRAAFTTAAGPGQTGMDRLPGDRALYHNGGLSFGEDDGGAKALDHDPRSPPQKGQSPIVRSILDAFWT